MPAGKARGKRGRFLAQLCDRCGGKGGVVKVEVGREEWNLCPTCEVKWELWGVRMVRAKRRR